MHRAHAAPAYLDNAIKPVSFFRSFPVRPARRWPVAVGDPHDESRLTQAASSARPTGRAPSRYDVRCWTWGRTPRRGRRRASVAWERKRTRCAVSYGDGRCVGFFFFARVALHGEFRAVMVVGWTVSTRAGTHGRSGHDSTANGTVKSKPPGTCTCVPRGTLARTAANHSFTLHPRLPAACVFF